MQNTWTKVDTYFTENLVPADEALDESLKASDEANLPQINVASNQGKLLMLMAQMRDAKNIL